LSARRKLPQVRSARGEGFLEKRYEEGDGSGRQTMFNRPRFEAALQQAPAC
jgi:hypothetical protein